MGEIAICICANMFRIYIVRRFFKIFFSKGQLHEKTEFLLYAIYYIINTGLYLGYRLAWLNIVNTMLGTVLLSFIYTTSVKKGFFTASLIYAVNMICDILSTLPFIGYQDGKELSQILFVMGDFLFLLFVLFLEKIIGSREEDVNQTLPLIPVPICSVIILFFMLYGSDVSSMEIIVASIGLLFINFFVLYLYNILLRVLLDSYENEISAKKASMYLNQLDLIKQNEERISSMRHDMRHHLTELRIMAENGDNAGIQNYIDSMEQYIRNPNEISSTGNQEVDSLLNYMLRRAGENLNDTDIKVMVPSDVLNNFDVNIVLGNLLENAMDAAAKTEEKILRGSIVYDKGVLRIRIENSYGGTLIKSRNGFLTTKADKTNHGIGLRSVQNALGKYKGCIEISEGELFCVSAVMYITDKNE